MLVLILFFHSTIQIRQIILLPYKQIRLMARFCLFLFLICTLCLLSQTTCRSYSASAASVASSMQLQSACVLSAKASSSFGGLPAFSASSAKVAATVVGYAESIFLGAKLLASSHPIAASAFASLAAYTSYQASYSQSYNYSQIDPRFFAKLSKARRITRIQLYASPLPATSMLPYHHEILLELDEFFWVVVSFGEDGMQVLAELYKQRLVQRRMDNMEIKARQVDRPVSLLDSLLIQYEGFRYHPLSWNCRDYASKLWNAITS